MDIKTFNKTGIDLSPLGFVQCENYEHYYCTPKNAHIIASSGIDGIHYCTVPCFGDIIFAVSPMNFRECVHPIARSFEDLLRLLLSCGDIAALEQCYAWDKEQYKAFLVDCPVTQQQQLILDEIRSRCGLEPMSDAFSYVKELQAEFDLSQIEYTEDYYDPEMNVAAPEAPFGWAVCFDGGFWAKNAEGEAGEEIKVNKSFPWGGEIWHIPSVYLCKEGLVVDFCIEIQPEKEKAFMDKWYPILADENNLSRELEEFMERENPMDVNFSASLAVNGNALVASHGCAINHIPSGCLPEGECCERDSGSVIAHYGLDENRVWCFHRVSFPWKAKRQSVIKSVNLKLERSPVAIDGIRFKNPKVGDEISFEHPVHKTTHKITVLGYEKQELDIQRISDGCYEFPSHHTAMTYTLEPDLSPRDFQLRDCLDNEQPKLKSDIQMNGASCVGIIGGADGPTAIFSSAGHGAQQKVALSSLRFEHAKDIEWKIVFRQKLTGDIEIELI